MSISAGGSRPTAMPLIYLSGDLLYRPDGGAEVIWDGYGAAGVANIYSATWYQATDPVIHGPYTRVGAERSFEPQDYGVFWVGGNLPDEKGFVDGQILFHQPLKMDIANINWVLPEIGSLSGGMDDLVIYWPNDLFKRDPEDLPDHPFGEVMSILEDSFMVTVDTGWMGQDSFGCKAFIHRIPYVATTGHGVGSGLSLPPTLSL